LRPRGALTGAGARVQNPFGAAKPREAVLADKLGLKEEDVLKKEVLKERVKVRAAAQRRAGR